MPHVITWTDEFGHKRQCRTGDNPDRALRDLKRQGIRRYRVEFLPWSQAKPTAVYETHAYRATHWQPDPRLYRAPRPTATSGGTDE